jgi:hypothetical protein
MGRSGAWLRNPNGYFLTFTEPAWPAAIKPTATRFPQASCNTATRTVRIGPTSSTS